MRLLDQVWTCGALRWLRSGEDYNALFGYLLAFGGMVAQKKGGP